MQTASTNCPTSLPPAGSSLHLALRTNAKLKLASPDAEGKSAHPRDISQITRLRYLLEAREAKVHAVLDEALSWLIVPFPSDAEGTHEKNVAAPAIEGKKSSPECSSSPSSAATSAAPSSGVPILVESPLLVGPDDAASSPACSPPPPELPAPGPVVAASAASSPPPAATEEKSVSAAESRRDGVDTEAKPNGAPMKAVNPTSNPSANADTHTGSAGNSIPVQSIPGQVGLPEQVSFTAEELEKLDAEAAWDELDAEDELTDSSFSLLPQLLAASPLAGDASSAPVSRKGAGALDAVITANVTAGSDSPKRKRGRPKGSGKKAKSRLDSGTAGHSGAVAEAPKAQVSTGGSEAQSPGSSGLANSPLSPWSGGSAENFPSLADLLDLSGDPSSLLGSPLGCPPLTSPATPSSATSSMLRSSSGSSSLSNVQIGQDDHVASSRVPVRSARLQATVQARRLMFAAEDDGPEEPLFTPKESKKSQKGKTGRPRGRPRKIRPHERVKMDESP